MIERQLKTANEMHIVALAAQCLYVGYWSIGFTPSNEQDPKLMASSCKGPGI
jgi:hypothetical protein